MLALQDLIENKVVWTAVASWAIAQIIKIIIDVIESKKLDLALIMSSGGMPSSHSSFVVAMSMAIGFKEGFNSSFFAICIIISLVVMYDAAGVRRAAGKQAAVLNIFIKNFEQQGLKIDEKLKELLGHSPIEVFAGAILGFVVALISYKTFGI